MPEHTQAKTIPIDTLQNRISHAFHSASPFPSDKMKKVSLVKKLWNEHRLKRLVNKALDELDPLLPIIEEHIESGTETLSPELEEVKVLMVRLLHKLDKQKLLFDEPFLTFFIEKGYMTVAEEFVQRVRKEDGQLSNEEIFQALRNVWIMNSLQIFWELPLKLNTPMTAYSLLYPYTDNFLDDAAIDSDAKRAFNERLSRSLAGEHVSSESPSERRIFSLVESILDIYPIQTHPEVTESIQLIHQAQIDSMRQCLPADLAREDVLAISLFKGGTSVLADAYLVKGSLTEKEMVFAYNYGAFLQLLDDLQDVKSDQEEGNQTLFSVKQSKEDRVELIRQLISLITVINSPEENDTPVQIKMKKVIANCTMLMVMETIGKNPDLVTSSFYKELEAASKVRLKTYTALESKIKKTMAF
ncbi:hypothetical protein GCM10008929_03290 [Alkalibacterium psychrotolerans]